MDYALEALGPDRFQQLCQALLAKEFAGVQCYPIGQADGGRDATAPLMRTTSDHHDFLLYQVKYHRTPLSISEPHKWVLETIQGEIPKVSALVSRGLTRYVVVTNVPGTGMLDRGSIDRVNKLLSDLLPVPASCWWRDDLERRLDNAWNLKWRFPDLLTGPDLVRYFIEARLNDAQERRTNAVRTFLADQYKADKEVKFKQVELQNPLFELFVDVPAFPADTQQQKTPPHVRMFHHLQRRTVVPSDQSQPNVDDSGPPGVGAARLLLDSAFSTHVPQLVLEGAPGQGKSTVTQYVCQIHRIRLLNHGVRIPTEEILQQSPLRLPIRVDLRDFAAWLSKKDPFAAEPNVEPAGWIRSLEGFLGALIRHHSGGAEFSVSDLHAVLGLVPVFIAFDGLDEVADIAGRQAVVDEIQKGISRLAAVAEGLQVIITSRPAAYANSPGFPTEEFPVFNLISLPIRVIEEYASKWLDARGLVGRERDDILLILRQKIRQPHFRDLARNPMQLAILLSLIHTRGASLPDKRTALYDAYVDVFLNREAEKSPIVRVHRGLLLEIHQYLAYVLQRDSELGQRGSISEEHLHSLVRSYLADEGRDPSLTELLFAGMVERVVALVARVQGTYEFEVQPLREYFAARFLADTAPYSPPGNERRGTKPDRFDAIARNFYWQNVTRFYAGCFSKGELLTLSDRLMSLISAHGYRHLRYPRMLAITFLNDWVFQQSPRAIKELVGAIGTTESLRYLTAQSPGHHGIASPVLADECGRKELVESALMHLDTVNALDFEDALLDVVRRNAQQDELRLWWRDRAARALSERSADVVRRLAVLASLENIAIRTPELLRAVGAALAHPDVLSPLIHAQRYDVFEVSQAARVAAVDGILNREISFSPSRSRRVNRRADLAEVLAVIHDAGRYRLALRRRSGVSVNDAWRSIGIAPLSRDLPGSKILDPKDVARTKELVETVAPAVDRPFHEWTSDVRPWDSLVETSRRLFGLHWAHYVLALESAQIPLTPATAAVPSSLFDESQSLCGRVADLRRRVNSAAALRKDLKQTKDETDIAFWVMAVVRLAPAAIIVRLSEDIDSVVGPLSARVWLRLISSLRRSSTRRLRADDALARVPHKLSPRGALALSYCFSPRRHFELVDRYLIDYSGQDAPVWTFIMNSQIGRVASDGNWDDALPIIKKAYTAGRLTDRFGALMHVRKAPGMPITAAETVVKDPESYPLDLLGLAETIISQQVRASLVPIDEVARREHWFE